MKAYLERFSLTSILVCSVGLFLFVSLAFTIIVQRSQEYGAIKRTTAQEAAAALDMLETLHKAAAPRQAATAQGATKAETLNKTIDLLSKHDNNLRVWLSTSENGNQSKTPLDAIERAALKTGQEKMAFTDEATMRMSRPVVSGDGPTSLTKCEDCDDNLTGLKDGQTRALYNVEVDMKDALHSLKIKTVGLIVSAMVITAFTLAVMLLLLRHTVLQPIKKLAVAARKMAQGNLNINFEGEHRSDFLGLLAQSLNQFIKSLQTQKEIDIKQARQEEASRIADKMRENEERLQEAHNLLEIRIKELEDTKAALSEQTLELASAKEQLEHIAYYDGLTGLANRASCQKDMAEKFTFVDRETKFAIIQIDLDNFKWVNDTLGHAAGDFLLKNLGKRLRNLGALFVDFSPYRWGGDEFIALVGRNEDTDLESICQEITDVVAVPMSYGDTILRPTVSLGVARYPEDGEDLGALMVFSDIALYKTKELGRDGYQFFTSDMKQKIDDEANIERELREAIENADIELFYQPQVDVDDESLTGIEALVRWRHPERGIISPGTFLEVAELRNLAPNLGKMIFDEAMTAISKWNDEKIEFGRLALNLSPAHLKSGRLAKDLFAAMEKHNVDSQHITVELLESLFLDDKSSRLLTTIEDIRNRGVHVELDDFGTGYASLSHVSSLPIDGLKIDKSFVNDMINKPKQLGVVSTMLMMSKMLGLRAVVEGVETAEQLEAMKVNDEIAIQGFYVAKPMNFADMTDWMKNKRNIGSLETPDDLQLVIA